MSDADHSPEWELAISDGERLLEAIERVTRLVVDIDLLGVEDIVREALIGHLTGALFVTVARPAVGNG